MLFSRVVRDKIIHSGSRQNIKLRMEQEFKSKREVLTKGNRWEEVDIYNRALIKMEIVRKFYGFNFLQFACFIKMSDRTYSRMRNGIKVKASFETMLILGELSCGFLSTSDLILISKLDEDMEDLVDSVFRGL